MLTNDKLHQLSIKKQTTELNIKREYVQHLLLSHFYQQKESGRIFFKGGTALKLLYGSPRFSEDLDFSTATSNFSEIELTMQNTLFEIERQGIKTNIIESKKTSGGYLAVIEFLLDKEKLAIQIEISFRDKSAKGEIITVVNDFIPAYTAMALMQELLIKQKIAALLDRKKPRDFYDLYFILRANLLSVKQREVLKKVLITLKSIDISFNKELKLFLPTNHQPQIRNFKLILEREINKYI